MRESVSTVHTALWLPMFASEMYSILWRWLLHVHGNVFLKVLCCGHLIVFILSNRKSVNGNARMPNVVILVTNFATGNHVTRLVRKDYRVDIRVTVSVVKTVRQNVYLVLVKRLQITTLHPGNNNIKTKSWNKFMEITITLLKMKVHLLRV